ncbi:DUF1289 domain-containing protein [Cupriavidus gilardii]|uniref:DUF1289 domain-containing protein n=1 Tax=Cupriavidus gilardii TaxID=82541 RepID=UPI0028F6F89C|nr:DUF1289 domain-containing protein [Cupriavidus gilardii]
MPADAKLIADLRRRALAAQYARPVASPCRDVCRMGQHGYCEGCFRTIDEIAGWANRRDEDKRAIWQMLPQRAAAAGTADTADTGDTGNTFDTSDTSNTGDTVQSGRP